jgi:hypothetical protein
VIGVLTGGILSLQNARTVASRLVFGEITATRDCPGSLRPRHLEVLPLQEVMLDFYHLSEHVAVAGKATLAEPEAGPWISQTLQAVRHEGYDAMFGLLLDWSGSLRGRRREPANRLINYVAQRQEMMGYSHCDAQGWDVGSGPMESMCGVTTDRIKGRGRRWNMENAVALMQLGSLHRSNLWDQYWDKRFSGQT